MTVEPAYKHNTTDLEMYSIGIFVAATVSAGGADTE